MTQQDKSPDVIQRMRDLLATASTRDILERCHHESIDFSAGKGTLISNARQIQLVLRVAMASPEPEDPWPISEARWNQLKVDLNRTFTQVPDELLTKPTREGMFTRSAHFHYYNNTLLADPSQIRRTVVADLVPFDDVIKETIGITASRSLEIALRILRGDEHTNNEIPLASNSQRSANSSIGTSSNGAMPFERHLIDLDRLRLDFGGDADLFLRNFSIGRGDGPTVDYPLERNPIEGRAVFRIDCDEAYVFHWNSVLEGVYRGLEDAIWSSSAREKYARGRSKRLEADTFRFIKEIAGGRMRVLANVFETPEGRGEHDIVAFDDQRCIIVEVKSARLKPPLHDPAKAYEQLRRAFKGDTGVQHAYKQASSLRTRIIGGGATLFSEKGDIVACIPKLPQDNVVCVCVTLDSFGPLATYGLHWSLDLPTGHPLPWVVNVWDLESIGLAWKNLRWDVRHLWNYLSQRLRVDLPLWADDELDYAGAYIRHRGLNNLADETSSPRFLHPWNQDVFESLYRLSQSDMRRFIRSSFPAFKDELPRQVPKVGRNELCPCRSGMKFKHCHGTI